MVLDELNRRLKPHGLWFPVDISTSSRATVGGMVGNNSCGARSLRYGNTRENVLSIDAVLADGALAHFGPAAPALSDLAPASPLLPPLGAVGGGAPEALFFVEFAGDDQYHALRRLMQLKDVIRALGLGGDKLGAKWGGVVEFFDPKLRAAIGKTRTAGLNIMMSM